MTDISKCMLVNEHGVECWFYKQDDIPLKSYAKQLNQLFPAGTYTGVMLTACPEKQIPMFVHQCLNRVSEKQKDIYIVCDSTALPPWTVEKMFLIAEFYGYQSILYSDAGLEYDVNTYRHESSVDVAFIPSASWFKACNWPIFSVSNFTEKKSLVGDQYKIVESSEAVEKLSEACLTVCYEHSDRMMIGRSFSGALCSNSIPVIFGQMGMYKYIADVIKIDLFKDLIDYKKFDQIKDDTMRKNRLIGIVKKLLESDIDLIQYCNDNKERFVKNSMAMNNFAFKLDQERNRFIKSNFQSGSKTVEYMY